MEKLLLGFFSLLTILYASHAKPTLPNELALLFQSPPLKVIIYVFIGYMATKNLEIALITAISFYILMSTLNEQKIYETFYDKLKMEGFMNFLEKSSGKNKKEVALPSWKLFGKKEHEEHEEHEEM